MLSYRLPIKYNIVTILMIFEDFQIEFNFSPFQGFVKNYFSQRTFQLQKMLKIHKHKIENPLTFFCVNDLNLKAFRDYKKIKNAYWHVEMYIFLKISLKM